MMVGSRVSVPQAIASRSSSLPWLLAAVGSVIGSSLVQHAPVHAVTLADNLNETSNLGVDVGYVSGAIDWQAMKFNTTTASVIDLVTVTLKKDSLTTAAGSLYLDIYTANGNAPGSFVGNVGTKVFNDIATSFTDYSFAPSSLVLSQNTSYFLVARPDGFDTGRYLVWDSTASTAGFGFTPPVRARSTTNGTSWINPGGGSYAQLQILASNPVPGPLPLLGASAAFAWSRRLRKRVTSAASSS